MFTTIVPMLWLLTPVTLALVVSAASILPSMCTSTSNSTPHTSFKNSTNSHMILFGDTVMMNMIRYALAADASEIRY